MPLLLLWHWQRAAWAQMLLCAAEVWQLTASSGVVLLRMEHLWKLKLLSLVRLGGSDQPAGSWCTHVQTAGAPLITCCYEWYCSAFSLQPKASQ